MSSKKPTVFIRSNGCQGRDLDVTRLVSYFELNGCRIVATPRKADHILFVSCCFKENRKQASLKTIRKMGEEKGELIVAGCLPEIEPTAFHAEYDGKWISTRKIEEIDKHFPDFKVRFSDVADANHLFAKYSIIATKAITEFEFSKNYLKQIAAYGVFNRKRFGAPYLRIGQGCNETCTFCGIRKAVGPLKSKPLETCLDEYRRLLEKKPRLLKIFSDNTGTYGHDIGRTLPELLDGMAALDASHAIEWFLQHLEPKWAIEYQDELTGLIEKKKITEIMLPVQSGSDRILKRMDRDGNTREVLACVSRFKDANPGLKIYTQIIVGFPTESDEDMETTLRFLKEAAFDVVMPFQFFDAEAAKARNMGDAKDTRTIEDRYRLMGKMLDREGITWLGL